jgi:hypothetical protein
LEARKNLEKIALHSSGGMPIPVSRTSPSDAITETVTSPPAGVYLIALPTRFSTTSRNSSGLARIGGTASASETVRRSRPSLSRDRRWSVIPRRIDI